MRLVLSLLFLYLIQNAYTQNRSEYGVQLVNELAYYQEQMKHNPDFELVNLRSIEELEFDIRYATEHNFTDSIIYTTAEAFARKPVVEALRKANSEFLKLGYTIKIYDAYRPYNATVRFYELVRDTQYVASPYTGSRHNRACAIDLTLVEIATGKELEMPTEYDDFSEKAHPDYAIQDKVKKENRDLLIVTMEKYGFKVYPYEWWHFDFEGWEKFPIMNLSFEALNSIK